MTMLKNLVGVASVLVASGAVRAAAPEGIFAIHDGGRVREFVVACDELQCTPAAGGVAHGTKITDQGTMAATSAVAGVMSAESGNRFELVLYEKGRERSKASRRVLRRKVLIELEPGADVGSVVDTVGAAGADVPSYAPGYAVLRFTGISESLTKLPAVRAADGVVSATPFLAKRRAKRSRRSRRSRRITGRWSSPSRPRASSPSSRGTTRGP